MVAGVIMLSVAGAFIAVRAHARARAIRISIDSVRRSRDILERPMRYRVAWPSDDDVVRPVRAAPACDVLVANGFTLLVDLVGVPEGGSAWNVVRIYVDPVGTMLAFVFGSARYRAPARVLLVSYTSDAVFQTLRAGPGFAEPPSWHRQSLDALTPTSRAIQRHRAFCGDAELVAITTPEAMRERLEREHDLAMRWRLAQPPDELLLADVRSLLGSRFERDGHRVIRRLRPDVPRATVV